MNRGTILFHALALALAVSLQVVFGGEVICEELPVGMCSFTISSSGKRCLLETNVGDLELQCKTSEVMPTNNMVEHVESEECISTCGVDRDSIGISSDSLLDPHFLLNLCSSACYHNCPNIIDLYYNLALAEGVYLPVVCKSQRSNRRSTMQLQSSSDATAAPGPIAEGPMPASMAPSSSSSLDCAPAPL